MTKKALVVLLLPLMTLTVVSSFGRDKDEVKPLSTKLGYPVYALTVEPFYHDDGHPDAFWHHLWLLESDGRNVFFGSTDNGIVRLDDNGRFVEKVGRIGNGPGEYEKRIISILGKGESVWIIGMKKLLHFQQGSLAGETPLQASSDALWAPLRSYGANHFDVSDRHVLLPFGRDWEPGQVGSVYDLQGKFVDVIRDPGFDKHLLSLSRWAQKIMWRFHAGKWFGVYMYTPRVIVLDKDFKQISELNLDSLEVREYEENFFLEDRKTAANPKRSIPMFFTFQIVRGMGFVKTMSGLLCFDLKTGKLKALYYFNLDDPDHGKVNRCGFEHCVVLDSGKVVLGNNALRGELQFTRLPGWPE